MCISAAIDSRGCISSDWWDNFWHTISTIATIAAIATNDSWCSVTSVVSTCNKKKSKPLRISFDKTASTIEILFSSETNVEMVKSEWNIFAEIFLFPHTECVLIFFYFSISLLKRYKIRWEWKLNHCGNHFKRQCHTIMDTNRLNVWIIIMLIKVGKANLIDIIIYKQINYVTATHNVFECKCMATTTEWHKKKCGTKIQMSL